MFFFLRKGGVFAYAGRNQKLKELKDALERRRRERRIKYRGTSLIRNSTPLGPCSNAIA
jgi:hypothetical protein